MSEFDEVVRRRRMCRSFRTDPVASELVDSLVDLAARAPSAGKTQGWHLVVLEGAQTDRFWRHTFAPARRDGFRWPGLFDAPVILLPFADPDAYVARYAEPDKARTGLGAGAEAWPTPYWTVDASMSVMTLLLAAEDAGLGALFFAVFHGAAEVRAELGVPDGMQLLGAIALGWPDVADEHRGASASRPRRTAAEIVHRGGW
ncbi:MAG: nitroreductase family protein [Ilumatobacteraceae bacterium]|nr:nitroreductase family protein [Acidimicrobiales bacterium]